MTSPERNDRFLDGETAIVTGAGRGIGRAVALVFARAGATVVVASRTSEQVEETAREITEAGGRDLVAPRREFPLKEKLSAHDVAEAALFLASPAAVAISGAVLDVWGGTHLSIKG